MRLTEPRVPPLRDDELSSEQRELLSAGRTGTMNIFRTLVRHPALYKSWMRFGAHVLTQSTLGAREREIAILRIGHLCDAPYELHQHTEIGRRVGLTGTELAQIQVGPDAPAWSPLDRAIVQAADDLHRDHMLSDATYRALSAHYDTKQLLDLIFTVGQYTLVCMALNSLGVQIERAGDG